MNPELPFEPHRFRSAAAHYLEGRPPYAAGLIARVAEICRIVSTDRVLDLGCGPGQLARAFAPYAAEVLGVDPEPEMLRVARAASSGFPNLTFREGSSYDLGSAFGTFRVVCMGRSFHWMDRADTLRRLDAMVAADGAVVLFGDTHPEVPDNAWLTGYRAVLDRYAEGDASRTRKSHGWVAHEGVLLDSPFPSLELVGVFERRRVTLDTLIARALSMSSTSRARLGQRADEMTADLARSLPPEGVREVVVSTALIARRP